MYEKALKESLQAIFGFSKVTFDQPGETKEQECLFVDITKSFTKPSQGRAISRAQGSCYCYVQADKLPFGYFAKKINAANRAHTMGLFFFNFDQNEKYYGNLVERRCDFVYFHSTQYNPEAGEIDTVTFIEG